MFSKIPKWVERLPELDREAIKSLIKSSNGDLSKPREMVHCLYDVRTNDEVREISSYLLKAGWTPTASPSADNPSLMAIEATKNDYVLTESTYITDVAFFNRIADLYSIHYDGWYASN